MESERTELARRLVDALHTFPAGQDESERAHWTAILHQALDWGPQPTTLLDLQHAVELVALGYGRTGHELLDAVRHAALTRPGTSLAEVARGGTGQALSG